MTDIVATRSIDFHRIWDVPRWITDPLLYLKLSSQITMPVSLHLWRFCRHGGSKFELSNRLLALADMQRGVQTAQSAPGREVPT